MLKKIIFITVIFLAVCYNSFSQIPITIKEKSIDSLYFQSKTKWITLTPFFIVNKDFSPDHGQTWENVGIFGGKVKPYLISDSIAVQNINIYKLTRAAGILQMWVIAPLLAYKHFENDGSSSSTGDATLDYNMTQEEQTAYLSTGIIVFLTGTFTYHVLSKTYLSRALHDYNQGIIGRYSHYKPNIQMNFATHKNTITPQLSLVWTF